MIFFFNNKYKINKKVEWVPVNRTQAQSLIDAISLNFWLTHILIFNLIVVSQFHSHYKQNKNKKPYKSHFFFKARDH